MRRSIPYFFLAFLCMAPGSHAATCQDSFQALGDSRNGMLYSSSVTRPGMSVDSALGQLQKIGVDEDLTPGAEMISGDTGELTLRWEKVSPAIVFKATANSSGRVDLGTKLPREHKMSTSEAVANICGMLDKLKAGKEGDAIAARARARGGIGTVADVEASELSAEIDSEIKKAIGPLNRKGWLGNLLIGTSTGSSNAAVREVFAPIHAKYMGRKYRIDGEVAGTSYNNVNNELRVSYNVAQRRGLLRVRESDSRSYYLNFAITCIMALDNIAYFDTLAQGDRARLIGTVSSFSTSSMELTECRQAK